MAAVVGRARSCVVGHARVVRGRAWPLPQTNMAAVVGRAWSCVAASSNKYGSRGRSWSVVRAWSCAVGRAWSCVVVRGRSCAVVRAWSVVFPGRAVLPASRPVLPASRPALPWHERTNEHLITH